MKVDKVVDNGKSWLVFSGSSVYPFQRRAPKEDIINGFVRSIENAPADAMWIDVTKIVHVSVDGPILYPTTPENKVQEFFDAMTLGERAHMVNKLVKEEILPARLIRLERELIRVEEEFDILEGACDFWQETAKELGYSDE